MMKLEMIPQSEFARISKLPLLADMCRLNTLVAVKKAGSGHLGSSLSAMDIVVYLYHHLFNVKDVAPEKWTTHPDRDIYFSSKGHDVPGFYAVMHSLGVITEERLLKLRRYKGLDGHPDVKIPGVEANSGSLGMGISKGKGIALAKTKLNRKGRVVVLVGDGEFQEGQNFEALQSAVPQNINNLIVVMDHNKLQSDRKIEKIVSLGNLQEKISAFGWHVETCDGHDFDQLDKVFKNFDKLAESKNDKPKFLIANTIKGRGISFMEHPRALEDNGGFYKWHAGAPDDASFEKAFLELKNRVQEAGVSLRTVAELDQKPSGMSKEFVAQAYGNALYQQVKKNPNLMVLDGDLSADCKLREIEDNCSKQFVEVGIAEQDMASMAGGLALQGMLPVVNSFATFLASRSNEQIYNNLTENKKAIYACHYAGLIPAGPGKSHQSLRDISLFGAFPNCEILQASNSDEIAQIVDYSINQASDSVMIRVNIGPSPKVVELPKDYRFEIGKGVTLVGTDSAKIALMAYGPVMLHEALLACQFLDKKGIHLKVINMPSLNRFDKKWVLDNLSNLDRLFILEDHSTFGGLGDHLRSFLDQEKSPGQCSLFPNLRFSKFGVREYPACGTPAEALKAHGLDGESLAERIYSEVAENQKA